MRTKIGACFLIFLLLAGQTDDAWALPLVADAIELAEDNDEYLPIKQEQLRKRSSSVQQVLFAVPNPSHKNAPVLSAKLTPGFNFAEPFGPSALYLFMSMQC
jgi:hypothetical protein